MLTTNATFLRKENTFETTECVVEKVIRLSGAEYDSFSRNMLRDQDFIRDNNDLMRHDSEGKLHCLLVVGEGRRDGILVDSSGSDYARYSAFIPNVESFLTAEQYPSLSALNKKLTDIVDFIAEKTGLRYDFDLRDFETTHGIDFMTNVQLRDVVLNMLYEKTEIKDWELDKSKLTVYYNTESLEHTAENLSVTKMDMYAYGYEYDGMTPLGKTRALELFDKGYEIYLLYENNTEGAAVSRTDIETFDGLLGIDDPLSATREQPLSFEAFILNRDRYDKGETVGEWLTLPADADTLHGLFERIGVDRPSEDAYSVTAVRVPYDCIRDCVTKNDSLDELNMLASYMNDMEDYELDKLQAILTSRITDIEGITALINLLDENNFSAVELIDAKNAYELGEYYILDVPYKMSFSEYGEKLAREEGGVFTDIGYLYNKYEQESEYTGVVPEEYKIVGGALQGLRSKAAERDKSNEPQSVLERIKSSRITPLVPKEKSGHKNKKDKGGEEH